MKKNSVKGLANIAILMNQAGVLPTALAAPKRERRDTNDIFNRTVGKLAAAVGLNVNPAQTELMQTFLKAGLRDAYNLGHADALDQNSEVERMLEKQYQTRTQVTMPAVVAAVMEQLGLTSMTLDLALMATVFDRTKITYIVSEENVISYDMRPVGEDE